MPSSPDNAFTSHSAASPTTDQRECPKASPTIDAILARLAQQLKGSARSLQVDLEGGRLVLRGKLPTFYQKQLAQEAVKRIDGVRQVTNQIQVT